MHHALREVLGNHVEQKGSLVHPDYLRFDFSHFQKVSDKEIRKIESLVNQKIRQNISREEWREMPVNEALGMGAMALFGEKYGNKVRVIRFGDSVELCGGTHVESTGQIGFFKITRESAIAAGIRRIEAITGRKAEEYIYTLVDEIYALKEYFPSSVSLAESIQKLNNENLKLRKELEIFQSEKKGNIKKELQSGIMPINGINFIGKVIPGANAGDLRDLSYQIKNELGNLFIVLGAEIEGKASLTVTISENLIKEKGLNASVIIREISSEIQGGGGGQPFFATAGGKKPKGLQGAIDKAAQILRSL
jgi:alanyl-tRNA synthetase